MREPDREYESASQSNWLNGETPTMKACGSRALIAAILLDAIQSVSDPGHLGQTHRSQGPERLAAMRRKDREWIESDRRTCPLKFYRFMSFVECCEALGLDHRRTREIIRERGWLDGSQVFTVAAGREIVLEQESRRA